MPYTWHPHERPPPIEPHSKAKLSVLRSYLSAYFDRLSVYPGQEVFKLDLIDGFAGGGLFLDGNVPLPGTPLIMLEETSNAKTRLNRGRAKHLEFDCKYYFVERNAAHAAHLQTTLEERGWPVDGERIVLRHAAFEDEIGNILSSIHRRQPRSGRALFLLDQYGYSRVALALVRKILQQLPNAEIILTFAADALLNFLRRSPETVKAVSPLELTSAGVQDLLDLRDGIGGKALAQRALLNHIRSVAGANFDTPFFIRPQTSRRALWLLHLSRHPTARDVMIQVHWANQNTFEHYGPGDFGMLGWDSLRHIDTLPLFHFDELDLPQMNDQLLNSLPRKLYSLVVDQPITVDALRHVVANRTAARFSDLDSILLLLAREGEFEILNPDGQPRSRSLRRLRPTDRIALPSSQIFPEWSRTFGK